MKVFQCWDFYTLEYQLRKDSKKVSHLKLLLTFK